MGHATMPRRARPDTAAPGASARTNRLASMTSRHAFSTIRSFRQDTEDSRVCQAMRLRHRIIHHQEREHPQAEPVEQITLALLAGLALTPELLEQAEQLAHETPTRPAA